MGQAEVMQCHPLAADVGLLLRRTQGIPVECERVEMEGYSKPQAIEKKNNPRAASYASRYVWYGRR
jgi:hypothetical protein